MIDHVVAMYLEHKVFIGYGLFIFYSVLLYFPRFIAEKTKSNKYLKKSYKKGYKKFYIFGSFGFVFLAFQFSDITFLMYEFWIIANTALSIFFVIKNTTESHRQYKKRTQSVQREKNNDKSLF